MANHCSLCDTHRPDEGTSILVLNGGTLWVEFCPPCGATETLTNPETGEVITIANLFNRAADEHGGPHCPTPDPERMRIREEGRRALEIERAAWTAKAQEEEQRRETKRLAQEEHRRATLRGGIGN